MKLCILGSTGRAGQRIVREAVDQGHDVLALVRDPHKAGPLLPQAARIVGVDFSDTDALAQAMAGQDAVINAAGYVTDGPGYTALVKRIIDAAEQALGPNGRFWLFGGAALLDVPGASRMTLDLPGIPALYRPHRINYDHVRATALDWSMLCPGPMTEAPDASRLRSTKTSTHEWPVPRPGYTRVLPAIALSLAFKNAIPKMTIHYEEAAKTIIDHLDRDGPLSRARVGLALTAD